jgi:Transcriptional regulator
MQIRQLEYFLAVANDGSFTAASERVHVVQSGVSAAIRSLERELGSPLFERTARGVVLSDAGTTLVPYAHAVLAQVGAGAAAVEEVRRGLRGTVVAGVLPMLGLVDLPPLIADYHHRYPDVAVHLKAGGTKDLAERLDEGELDFALISPVGPIPQDLRLTRLGRTPFVTIVPPEHSLAGHTEVTWEELTERPFIDSPMGFGNRDLLDQQISQLGLRRQVAIEAPDATAIPRLVERGAGVAVVPGFVAEGYDDRVRILPAPTPLYWSLFLATADHHPPSHAAQLLIREIKAAMGETPPDAGTIDRA